MRLEFKDDPLTGLEGRRKLGDGPGELAIRVEARIGKGLESTSCGLAPWRLGKELRGGRAALRRSWPPRRPISQKAVTAWLSTACDLNAGEKADPDQLGPPVIGNGVPMPAIADGVVSQYFQRW